MTNNDVDGDLEYWKKQLKIAINVMKKETYPLPTADETTSRNNRLKLCREKIAELEG